MNVNTGTGTFLLGRVPRHSEKSLLIPPSSFSSSSCSPSLSPSPSALLIEKRSQRDLKTDQDESGLCPFLVFLSFSMLSRPKFPRSPIFFIKVIFARVTRARRNLLMSTGRARTRFARSYANQPVDFQQNPPLRVVSPLRFIPAFFPEFSHFPVPADPPRRASKNVAAGYYSSPIDILVDPSNKIGANAQMLHKSA